MCLAIKQGHVETIEFLLSRPDIDINTIREYQYTLIAKDSQGGTQEISDMPLACEDINVKNQDVYGDTPLTSAAQGGQEQIFQSLIRRPSADRNHSYIEQYTPLILAASDGQIVIVGLVLACKDIEIDAREHDGITAIAQATSYGYVEIVRLLIKKGADYNLADMWGETPLIRAAYKGRKEATKVLWEAMLRAEPVKSTEEQKELFLQHMLPELRDLIDVGALMSSWSDDPG